MGHAGGICLRLAAMLRRVAAAPAMGRGMKRAAYALTAARSAILGVLFLGSSLSASTFYVTVAGLGGEPEYEQRFASQAQEIDKLVRGSGPDAKVTTLYGPQ